MTPRARRDVLEQVRRCGNTIEVDLLYPPPHDPPLPGDYPSERARYVEVDLCDVRATDPIRIYFDFDRNGYVVEQPRRTDVLVRSEGEADYYDERVEWIEQAFLPAFRFERIKA